MTNQSDHLVTLVAAGDKARTVQQCETSRQRRCVCEPTFRLTERERSRVSVRVPVGEVIEQCLIGETLLITSSPPHLGAFYNNEKQYFVY